MKQRIFLSIAFCGMLMLAACGSSTSSAPAAAATNTPVPPTETRPPSSGATITTASVMIKNTATTVLTDASGKTLYIFDPDTATKLACTGGCATTWPPLVASGTPTANPTLPGILTQITDAGRTQVAYNGHALYTYVGDSGPGMANGDGAGGKWHVATPSLAPLASTDASGGYTYP